MYKSSRSLKPGRLGSSEYVEGNNNTLAGEKKWDNKYFLFPDEMVTDFGLYYLCSLNKAVVLSHRLRNNIFMFDFYHFSFCLL